MGYLLGALIIFIIVIVLLIIGATLKVESEKFEKNKRKGRAVVVGYERAKKSDWYELMVKIPELNDDRLYNCQASKTDISKYPKGTELDVMYAPIKVAGINIAEVHSIDNPPANRMKIRTGILCVTIVLFVILCIFAIIGIISLL